ncbi:MAG: hypothetical protein AB7U83_17425 [Vicinamibacterales bacterium]
MPAIQWRQVLITGSFAGVSWAFLSIPLLVLLGGDTIYAVPRPLVTPSRVAGFTLDLVAGAWAMWLYAVVRPRYTSGWRAAAIAGFSWWLIATITTWQWADIGFLSLRDLVWLIAVSLPSLVVAAIVAARSYEAASSNRRA